MANGSGRVAKATGLLGKARALFHGLGPKGEYPSHEARTIDLSRRAWGCNYNILKIENSGQRLQLATWSTPTPLEGDYLILKDAEQTTRYRAAKVDYCGDPHDMCFVDAEFAPR
jgi:hypothetical protein